MHRSSVTIGTTVLQNETTRMYEVPLILLGISSGLPDRFQLHYYELCGNGHRVAACQRSWWHVHFDNRWYPSFHSILEDALGPLVLVFGSRAYHQIRLSTWYLQGTKYRASQHHYLCLEGWTK